MKLLSVTVTEDQVSAKVGDLILGSGLIQIDLVGGVSIRLEAKVDPVALRAVVEALRP
ncbi:hypothetical protein [Granulicella rosea]|uniref:hypothetical protein n=1 Tax=Granulicella rosea TaxID=474952 RepID=UPI00159570C2|nr:hypothetical protein [Granulicella rosea]